MIGCRHLDMIADVTPSSPNRHASKHAAAVGHPLVRSMAPGEDWAWCFVDEVDLEAA